MKQSKMKLKNNKTTSAYIKAPVNVILILLIHQFKKQKQRQKKERKRKHIGKILKHKQLSVTLNVFSRRNKPVI